MTWLPRTVRRRYQGPGSISTHGFTERVGITTGFTGGFTLGRTGSDGCTGSGLTGSGFLIGSGFTGSGLTGSGLTGSGFTGSGFTGSGFGLTTMLGSEG